MMPKAWTAKMKLSKKSTLACAGILSASVLAAAANSRTHHYVYCVSCGSVLLGGERCGPEWHIGSWPESIGFAEYTHVDFVTVVDGVPKEGGKRYPTYTVVDFGSRYLRVPARAWVVGVAFASGVAS